MRFKDRYEKYLNSNQLTFMTVENILMEEET